MKPDTANYDSSFTSDEPMRSLGTLKLPEQDAQKFLDALAAYGHERSAAFLRRCAYALILHHERGDVLESPLRFKTSKSSSPFESQ